MAKVSVYVPSENDRGFDGTIYDVEYETEGPELHVLSARNVTDDYMVNVDEKGNEEAHRVWRAVSAELTFRIPNQMDRDWLLPDRV